MTDDDRSILVPTLGAMVTADDVGVNLRVWQTAADERL
jgi:hypothetical protein